MLSNIIYTTANSDLQGENVIYTGTYNNSTTLQYCMLRSDLVLLIDKNKHIEEWCALYRIPFKYMTDTFILTDLTKLTIIESKDKVKLNYLFKLIKEYIKENDLIVYSNTSDNPGTTISGALI